MKIWIKAAVTTLTLALSACGNTPTAMTPSFNPRAGLPVRFQSNAAAKLDLNTLLPLLKDVYGKELADSLQGGKPTPEMEKILQQQGPAAYKLLSTDAQVRAQLYPLSDQGVIREFNKHAPADNVPPISSAELQGLLQKMQPGDVILCGNDKSFVHGALYLGQGQIVHALATQPDMPNAFRGVVQESLSTYLQRSERDTFVVLRARSMNPADFQRVQAFARQQVGKGYDSLFLNASDERFYCTELVWKALRQMSQPPRVQPHKIQYGWEMVTVEDFMAAPDLDTVWQRNYQRPGTRR
ncbi:MAG: YiiX/YebB-like N1pC/P60 family cysteine hydrolase [Candidatus Sericytochromatia bacterium]